MKVKKREEIDNKDIKTNKYVYTTTRSLEEMMIIMKKHLMRL